MQKKEDGLEQRSWWHPSSFSERRHFLDQRAKVIAAIRRYFDSEGFMEVETPALQVCPGMEPHLQAFSTTLENPFLAPSEKRYLHTSPELAMKKLLVAGAGNIFQLARCYRNRERSSTHHPEFTMLEWYRVGASYQEIMEDCVALLRACVAALAERRPLTWNGVNCDAAKDWQRLSVCEAFQLHAGVDLLASIDNPLAPAPEFLAKAAQKIGIACSPSDTWEDVFFRIFLERIEGKLGVGAPTILYDYPISMAALSRPKQSDPRIAERFEVYVCGLELANAFSELTDAKVQRERFLADSEKKEKLYGYRFPIDEEFLAALEYGYPESAGIALGVDRLVMLITGAPHIENVLWAPVESSSTREE